MHSTKNLRGISYYGCWVERTLDKLLSKEQDRSPLKYTNCGPYMILKIKYTNCGPYIILKIKVYLLEENLCFH